MTRRCAGCGEWSTTGAWQVSRLRLVWWCADCLAWVRQLCKATVMEESA